MEKNEEYNPKYIFIIQEKEQELSSLLGFEKAVSTQKIAPIKLRLYKVNIQ